MERWSISANSDDILFHEDRVQQPDIQYGGSQRLGESSNNKDVALVRRTELHRKRESQHHLNGCKTSRSRLRSRLHPAKAAVAARSEMFRNAVKTGVKISFGTDVAVFPHGQKAKEFKLVVDLGMAPIDALRSATASNAELLGIAQKVGTLEKEIGRHYRDTWRSKCRHHSDGACLIRHERRQNRQERATQRADGTLKRQS